MKIVFSKMILEMHCTERKVEKKMKNEKQETQQIFSEETSEKIPGIHDPK
jgi:hypothetical protein